MSDDFDAYIDRRGTFSTKWDKYRSTDILPLWVADMDFRSPASVIMAIKERAEHGVFGYTLPPDELVEIIIARLEDLYDWSVKPADIVFLPGVVPGLNMACRGLTEPAQSVVTATPVYFPFLDAPGYSGRALIQIQSECRAGAWHYPLTALEGVDGPGLLLLCNPHNPLGRCLRRDELEGIVRICNREQRLICADEIHCDLLFDERRHIPVATLDGARDITVTLMAASKTFNLAGIGGAFAIIENPDLRERFVRAGRGILAHVNLFAYTAMLSAYRDCADWQAALVAYLQNNRDYLAAQFASLPAITMNHVEATYLAWLDVRALGLDDPVGFFERAGVGLSGGDRFGGPGFLRLNFGCSRSLLEEAVRRMTTALGRL